MLKNDIPELCLYFDLEWVPDAAGARRLYGLPPETTELEAMQALWEHSPQYDAETNPRPFLKYMFSRVVAISYLARRIVYRDEGRTVEFRLGSFPELPVEGRDVSEAEIIERFLDSVGRRRPQLVGYNSVDSDLQVLIQRGMINEISAPGFSKRPEKPWDGDDYFDGRNSEGHLDILKRFSFDRSMQPKLDELAKFCGFPGKIDMHGDQVTDLWLAGDLRSIIEYNQTDVLNTYLVWMRLAYFSGKLASEEYFEELEGFRSFLEAEIEKPEKAFLQKFLDKWPA
ncbi:MAG: putative 3'-5' exonuclease related to the exonuclease domain of PolB [Acidobacteria bacterium OLB17]|nr:MAG: putative 3'-5' exonuclease related to the exonuclease domain of PolB [Acidobacteria bacterium OLB17]MCZ2391137.1 3'-5' exonuclease [Acidobacteriota bacterium]